MKPKTSVAAVLLSLPLAASAQSVDWTQWKPSTVAAGTIHSGADVINVDFDGDFQGLDFNAAYFANTTSFTNAEVSNSPGANGSVRMFGAQPGHSRPNQLHFSTPVTNPYMAWYSVGQPGVPVHVEFVDGKDATTGPSLTILSQGAGNWGGGTLVLSGPSTLLGNEGNGIVRLNGTFSDIYFWTPDREVYYGFTVGVAAVPEPVSAAMLLAGLGMVGWARRRALRLTR